MSSDNFKLFIQKNLSENSLIVVSNREPYQHNKTASAIRIEKPAGGLTSAMDEALKATGGTWVAWGSGSEDRKSVDRNNRIAVPPGKPAYTLKRVWLTNDQIDNYYHGYSNHVLWPLCHISLDRVYLRRKYWEDYIKANEAFAKAVLEEITDKSIVWIHDYHLCLVPGMLRKKAPDLTIAHFWHIPWPNFEVFRICPQSRELFTALLSNNLIGFQIPLFVHNFMECVKESLEDIEIDYQNDTVTYNGHTTKLEAFPISVDFERFNAFSASSKTSNSIERLKKRYSLEQKFIGIGVDRLEYTKGLIKRFQALDLFFDSYPDYRGKFTFIQIAVPTRLKEPYISYKTTVESFVRKINKKYSLDGWNPIVYRDTKSEHEDLAAYYRMADVAIISSIFDGMNLVAKEFIASQSDKKGVLLLSEFAGAAEELEGAMLVNPYDIEEFSECIKNALEMPDDEKLCRINTLQRQVKEKDIYRWISDFIAESTIVHSRHSRSCSNVFDSFDEIPNKNVFLFLDYDGTLTPIAESPDKAIITEEIYSMITELRALLPVAIITGRSLENIMDIIGIEKMLFAGNHGAEIWDGNSQVINQDIAESTQIMKQLIKQLRDALSSIQGVIIEDKGITASIHFRMVNTQDVCKMHNIFWPIADNFKKLFKITSGKKVFEIRPYGIWNKGNAVNWIWENYGKNRTPIYIGDDTTDEDAFRAIRGKGIGISVGKNSEADYYVHSQKDVKKLLGLISEFSN
jgi:alpha,alpha-trehalose-phosphate synthase [UDP-forming]/trehalose-phosphatase